MVVTPVTSGVLAKYREFLPITDNTPMLSLGEGDTPLVRSETLGKQIGCKELYFKLEGCNPTGSFKDRGMVVAVAKALEHGSKTIMCASTGNTSASAAAYGGRSGIATVVVVPKGEIAHGKLVQAKAYGARIISINGSFDQALELVRTISNSHPITLVNSVNPDRIEGQKTAAFEIVESLSEAPDYLCIPVGNAGNIGAYWQGFLEYMDRGFATQTPRMLGFQAEGASPIVKGFREHHPTTIASAIRIGNPASWAAAERARDQSSGAIEAVTDTEILEAYKTLATQEGIFCEPASAAAVAGLINMTKNGLEISSKRVVCVVTGNGLKDPELAERSVETNITYIEPKAEALESALMISARSKGTPSA